MVDTLLHLAFRLTRSRAISEMISERRCDRRWKAAKAAAIARGASVVTIASRDGSTSFVVEG